MEGAPALNAPYVSLKVLSAFAGTLSASVPPAVATNKTQLGALDASSSLEPAFGLAAQYTFALHPGFGLGGQLALLSLRSSSAAAAGERRSLAVDVALVPQGRIQLGRGFELYVAVPVGLTLSAFNEATSWIDRHPAPTLGRVEDIDPAYGWSLGALLGARILLGRRFGFLIEVGYVRHQVSHPVDVRIIKDVAGVPTEEAAGAALDLAVVAEQLGCNLGVFF